MFINRGGAAPARHPVASKPASRSAPSKPQPKPQQTSRSASAPRPAPAAPKKANPAPSHPAAPVHDTVEISQAAHNLNVLRQQANYNNEMSQQKSQTKAAVAPKPATSQPSPKMNLNELRQQANYNNEMSQQASQPKTEPKAKDSTATTVLKSAGSFLTGIWDAGKDTVTGVYDAATHPVATAKAIETAVTHPVQTYDSLKQAAKNLQKDWNSSDAEGKSHMAGEALGQLAMAFVPGADALKATDVVVDTAKTASAVRDVAEASDAAKVATDLSKASKAAKDTTALSKDTKNASELSKATHNTDSLKQSTNLSEKSHDTGEVAAQGVNQKVVQNQHQKVVAIQAYQKQVANGEHVLAKASGGEDITTTNTKVGHASSTDSVVSGSKGTKEVNSTNPAATGAVLHRPYVRKAVRQSVENNTPKSPDGRFLDANTNKPINGPYDLGHKPGNENWRESQKAQQEGLTQKQFNDKMNNPDLYQLEDPSSNRSHKYEMPK